jgi:hypothetical protein
MDEWVRYMEEVIIPFQVSKGMVILGSFRAEDDPTKYVWLRRFDSEEERARLYAEVYQSDHWRNVIGPRIPEMMVREEMVVTRLVPTPKSPIR